jgi:hypothetical protein
VKLTWLENNDLRNLKGVIPVADGVSYECVYQNYKDGKWLPIENPSAPMIQFSGYGKPLTKDQLNRLSQPMGR